MQLKLYKTSDAPNVINKTLTGAETLNIVLKRDTDIVNPVLYLTPEQSINYFEFNYCEITELGRKYFIVDVETVGPLFRLALQCDVLETYKAGILASHCRYRRNIKTGDYQNVSIETESDFEVITYNSNEGFTGDPSMILTTIGGVSP